MAKVEIYKLKKFAPAVVRDYSVFDYMRNGENPNPLHYVREWAGEMHGTLPLTIPGRLMLEPPTDYHGGNIRNGDIAVVEGKPFYFDKLQGAKFVELDIFDTEAVKDALHVKYGWFVDVAGAEPISDNLSYVCDDLGIPCGYLGEEKPGGVYNNRLPFLPGASGENHLSFLHPQFLIGGEARTFAVLLSELTEADRWTEVFDYLRECYPINQQDLEKARELFAPELFLPEELRSLSKIIPADADKTELDYLAVKIGGMNENQQNTFYAVIEAGWYCKSVTEIINLTENLEHFDLEPAFTESQYGEFRLENDYDICEAAIQRLEKSEDPSDRFLVKYITLLNRCADDKTYGYHAAKEDGGAFTKYGYISQGRGLDEKYHGIQDIPADNGIPALQPTVEKKDLVMLGNGDLSTLLLEMHALGGYPMTDAKHNLQTIAGGGSEFVVVMNNFGLIVTPAEPVFQKGTREHDALMAMDKSSDTRTFVLSVTDRKDDRVFGSLCETDIATLQSSIKFNSIESNDPASVGQLAAFLDNLRWEVQGNRRAIPDGLFLQQINEPYMAKSHAPRPDWYRVSPDAAREYLAGGGRFIFKAHPEPFALLAPIDAAKASLWTGGKFEFFIRHDTRVNHEKWAQRAAGEMLRQTERGEQKKTRDAEK